ncbi:hypothetical protein ABFS83_08G121600 [Erythranthe nasuta]
MPGSLYATRQRQSGRWIGGGGRRMRSQACCKPPSSYPSPSSPPVISVGANFNIFYICMYVSCMYSLLELTSSCRYIKSQLKGQASLMKSNPIYFHILKFFPYFNFLK